MGDMEFDVPDDFETEIELPAALPVLALKDTVVFPQSMMPLAIGQERSIRLIDDVVAGDRLLALVTARDASIDAPGFDDIYTVGTVAVVHKMLKIPDGTLRILVGGLQRVKLVAPVSTEPYLVGEFEALPDENEETPEVEALTRNVQGLFAQIIGLAPYLPAELQLAATNVDDGSALAHLVASTLRTIPTEERQELLEEPNVEKRLRRVSAILSREVEVLELGSKIQSQVQSEMEKGQREYFLRQQLKAIQQELGEGDPEQAEVNELRERLAELNLPEEVRKSADRELGRLERLPPAAAEYGVIRNYLEWIQTLPWDVSTEDNLDLENARSVLDRDHFDLEKVKDRIVEHLAVAKLRNEISGQILCFVGPPGVGKTSLGPVDREGARPQVRAHVGRRRPRRGRDPRPPPHLHRRDAGHDHPLAPRRRVAQPGDPDRRDRQDGRRLPRRPVERDARGARPRAEQDLPRPLPRPPVRPVEGAVHLHREHARHDPGAAARPDGHDLAVGLHGRREARDRQALPAAEAARGSRPQALAADDVGHPAADGDPRVHPRGGRPEPRAPAGGHLPQGRDPGREGQGAEDARRRQAAARVARAAPVQRRGAAAHVAGRRCDRSCLHDGRRRRAVHRGGRIPGQGRADHHRPARGRDEGVGEGRALLGPVAHARARRRGQVVRGARPPHPRARRAPCPRTGRRRE